MFYIVAYIACYAARYTNIHIISHLHVEILSITLSGGLLVAESPSSCRAGLPQRPLCRARVSTPWYKCQATIMEVQVYSACPPTRKRRKSSVLHHRISWLLVFAKAASHLCAPSDPHCSANTGQVRFLDPLSRTTMPKKKKETQKLGDGIEPPTSG